MATVVLEKYPVKIPGGIHLMAESGHAAALCVQAEAVLAWGGELHHPQASNCIYSGAHPASLLSPTYGSFDQIS